MPVTCHTALEAQSIRIQYEVRELLCDSDLIVSFPVAEISANNAAMVTSEEASATTINGHDNVAESGCDV